jgi:poly(A) polymerase
MRSLAQGLRLSNALRDRLVAAVGGVVDGAMTRPQARAALYRLGAQAFADRLILAWAASGEGPAAARWRDLLALARDWTPPVFPLGGDDALAAGAQGRRVGEALRAVEAWWIERDFAPGREAALDRLRAVVAGEA